MTGIFGNTALGVIAILTLLGGCGRAPQPAEADRAAGFLGVALPWQSVDVAPETAGRIERVYVREGDPVRRGSALRRGDG